MPPPPPPRKKFPKRQVHSKQVQGYPNLNLENNYFGAFLIYTKHLFLQSDVQAP